MSKVSELSMFKKTAKSLKSTKYFIKKWHNFDKCEKFYFLFSVCVLKVILAQSYLVVQGRSTGSNKIHLGLVNLIQKFFFKDIADRTGLIFCQYFLQLTDTRKVFEWWFPVPLYVASYLVDNLPIYPHTFPAPVRGVAAIRCVTVHCISAIKKLILCKIC